MKFGEAVNTDTGAAQNATAGDIQGTDKLGIWRGGAAAPNQFWNISVDELQALMALDAETAWVSVGAELAGDGTDDSAAFLAAIAAGGAGHTITLDPTRTYGLASVVSVAVDDITIQLNGAKITLLSGATKAFNVTGSRFKLFGPGTIDCAGLGQGVTLSGAGRGLTIGGDIVILNAKQRVINVTDAFGDDPSEAIRIGNLLARWDADKIALCNTVLPLWINIQGTAATDVDNIWLKNVLIDMSNWSLQQVAEVSYPSGSANQNVIGYRLNQSGTGWIRRHSLEGCVMLYPIGTDPSDWDPESYDSNPADSSGVRRPTCAEIKTSTIGQVEAGVYEDYDFEGGDLQWSFGDVAGLLRLGLGRCVQPTHYCVEVGNCDAFETTPGSVFDGRNAWRPITATNCPVVRVRHCHIIGPKTYAGAPGPGMCIYVDDDVHILDLHGSTFENIAANAGESLLRPGSADVIDLSNTYWKAVGAGTICIDHPSGTIGILNLHKADFEGAVGVGAAIDNAGTITSLFATHITGHDNAGGFVNTGTVTKLSASETSGISGLPESYLFAYNGVVGQTDTGILRLFGDHNATLSVDVKDDGSLNINTNGSTAADTGADNLVIRQENGNAGASILAGASNFSALYLGRAGSLFAGGFDYSHASDTLRAYAAGVIRVTLTATALEATTNLRVLNGTAIPAGGTAGAGYKFSSATNFGVFFGSGAPSLAAAKGSLYLRSDGSGTNDRAYINTDGSTTWTALVTVA